MTYELDLDVMGLDPHPDPGAVRTRYRSLAFTHHPDRSTDPDAKAVFTVLVKAYNRVMQEIRKPQVRLRDEDEVGIEIGTKLEVHALEMDGLPMESSGVPRAWLMPLGADIVIQIELPSDTELKAVGRVRVMLGLFDTDVTGLYERDVFQCSIGRDRFVDTFWIRVEEDAPSDEVLS